VDLTGVEIETERLRLVPISMDYAEDIFAEFTDEVTKLMYPRAPVEIEETNPTSPVPTTKPQIFGGFGCY